MGRTFPLPFTLMTTHTQLNASEKMAMQVVLSALKPLSKLRRSMPLPFATTFLLVAVDEGRTVSSYAHQLASRDL